MNQTGIIKETLKGIVDRVTFHNPDNGWSILKVMPFDNPGSRVSVIVHQTKVFAGATMEFRGTWTVHPKYGRQFKADIATEKKPATTAALEKYLGSGLIKGVGPKTAAKIVRHFGSATLEIFEKNIQRLTEVPGIADKKLDMIQKAWTEHRAIREVMMFLQSHGISTLFAVRIYKKYGDDAISIVTGDPYRLANDFYGIGFFSADKVALSIGFAPDSPPRIIAGIKHVLSAGRNFGHCFLTFDQIKEQVKTLLNLDLADRLSMLLENMEEQNLLKVRYLPSGNGMTIPCYYSKSIYYDEKYIAAWIKNSRKYSLSIQMSRVERWIDLYCRAKNISLSDGQAHAVKNIVRQKFSILTGGPGCGKTTATKILVKLIQAMNLKTILAAPTGRAAQRMTEVIGQKAGTIHRLLGWQGQNFKKNQDNPLKTDFLIVDECSMLDTSLTASLLRAVPENAQVLFIGDSDQLPSVGPGNILKDMIESNIVPCFKLTQVFRQALNSKIIKYAHQINKGLLPWIQSPFKNPEIWQDRTDCIFIDSDEATMEQVRFIAKVKNFYNDVKLSESENPFEFRTNEKVKPYESEINIPEKFKHVDLQTLYKSRTRTEALKTIIKKIHPWSSLNYGLSALDVIKKLYRDWIPKYYGNQEIQILSPMTRGSLGTMNLNRIIQEVSNPAGPGKQQLKVSDRIFRTGDRVIHRRNNYDLKVFNGDIGIIKSIDPINLTCIISFYPGGRQVIYRHNDMIELDLAYAITIHKAQGSEFGIVIIPVLSQHFNMLFRNLIYTGITRARKLAVFVGTRKALAMAVKNQDINRRQTGLRHLLQY